MRDELEQRLISNSSGVARKMLGRGITTIAWVLTSFNLVLALLAVPAAFVARRRPKARLRA